MKKYLPKLSVFHHKYSSNIDLSADLVNCVLQLRVATLHFLCFFPPVVLALYWCCECLVLTYEAMSISQTWKLLSGLFRQCGNQCTGQAPHVCSKTSNKWHLQLKVTLITLIKTSHQNLRNNSDLILTKLLLIIISVNLRTSNSFNGLIPANCGKQTDCGMFVSGSNSDCTVYCKIKYNA